MNKIERDRVLRCNYKLRTNMVWMISYKWAFLHKQESGATVFKKPDQRETRTTV